MGFFARLFGKKQTSEKPAKQSVRGNARLAPWPQKPLDKTLELPDESGFTLYVYDDSAFSSAKYGDDIQVEFFAGEAYLKSKKSGSEIDTRESDAVCLLHRGHPVGVIFFGKEHAKFAYTNGIRLLANATVGEELPEHGNIRGLTIHLPDSWTKTRRLIENYELNKRIPGTAQTILFNEWDEDDHEQLRDRAKWVFEDANLEYLPVPKGSSAKPHIIATSTDGRKIFRLTARNSVYREVASAMESSSNYVILAERHESYEGLVGYRIQLAHW